MPRNKLMLERQRTTKDIVEEINNRAADTDAKPAVDVQQPVPKTASAEPIDAAGEEGQSLDVVQVSEEDRERAYAEKVAKRLGWVPLDQWKRDPAKHRSAEQFLEDTPRELEAHKERARRAAQAAEAAFEDDRRRLLAEAEAKVRAAADAKDPEAAAAAAREVAAHSGPPPQTVAWIGRNPWFNEDRGAQAVAITAIRRAEAAGLNIEDQLGAGEDAVKRRFPEYFADATPAIVREAPKEEVRLSEIKRPPAVNAPSRTTPSEPKNKEKGYADIPQAMRQDFERHQLRMFRNRGLTTEQAQERYAKAYWKELPA